MSLTHLVTGEHVKDATMNLECENISLPGVPLFFLFFCGDIVDQAVDVRLIVSTTPPSKIFLRNRHFSLFTATNLATNRLLSQ